MVENRADGCGCGEHPARRLSAEPPTRGETTLLVSWLGGSHHGGGGRIVLLDAGRVSARWTPKPTGHPNVRHH